MKKLITCIFIFLTGMASMAQKTAEEAKAFFNDYKTTETITDLIRRSLPTLEECEVVFSGDNAKNYFNSLKEMKAKMNEPTKEGETFVDIGIEIFTTQDIKDGKGNYAGGMTKVVDKLNDNITFYKLEQLRTIGAEYGMAYNYWVYINKRWVFFPKPWKVFKD